MAQTKPFSFKSNIVVPYFSFHASTYIILYIFVQPCVHIYDWPNRSVRIFEYKKIGLKKDNNYNNLRYLDYSMNTAFAFCLIPKSGGHSEFFENQ